MKGIAGRQQGCACVARSRFASGLLMGVLATAAVSVLTGATASEAQRAPADSARAQSAEASANAGGEKPVFERVIDKARARAGEPFRPPTAAPVPQALKGLDERGYDAIRFREDEALWADHSPFSVEFHHLGFLYQSPVKVNEIVGGDVRPIEYRPERFDFGGNDALREAVNNDLGFAGLRVHYPLNEPGGSDPIVSFLGASYFRMAGRDQRFGLSARGLAVDTALPSGEEFPHFVEFWLVRPAPDATTLTFYALLDSESVAGAYRFELDPNRGTVLDVDSHLFARRDVTKLGVAPLTSMFMWGENRVRHVDDHRPEVHDSDGLLMHTGRDEWIWRPLTNPNQAQVSSLLDDNPRGFGLVQRDRHFRSYQDPDRQFGERPSIWVKPKDDWGIGSVQLIEIPSAHESNNNVVAFWAPDQALAAGEHRRIRYSLETFWARRDGHHLARVQRTRIGRGVRADGEEVAPPGVRRFVVDFTGGPLARMQDRQPISARLSAAKGEARALTVRRLPDGSGWRVAFNLVPDGSGQAVDMRLSLWLHGHRLTETWNYVWDPKRIQ
ncbi:MAG: glucan biosynthesis protein G [Halofilum sp. (in: g-proteobacteria)]